MQLCKRRPRPLSIERAKELLGEHKTLMANEVVIGWKKAGICRMCGKSSMHAHRCKACGWDVCEDHYDKGSGMCLICKNDMDRGKRGVPSHA